MGPAVTLAAADSVSASFTAPSVASDTLLRFELMVTDPFGLTDTDTASVTVQSSASGNGNNSIGSGGGSAMWLLLVLFGWLLFERVLLDDRLRPVRTRRDDVDRHTR